MSALAMRVGSGILGALALAAAGCEDPPPPTPAGAFSLTLFHSGASCNLDTHPAVMGVVGKTGDPDYVSDGADGAEVSCTVEAAGSGFSIKSNLRSGANVIVSVNSISADNLEDNPAEGSVQYVSPETGGELFASFATPCLFWVSPDDGQFVKAGSAWVSFSCEAIEKEGHSCAIEDGFMTVKNCDGATNEE